MTRNYLDGINFFHGIDPRKLTEAYGSPLYVYNESILRERARDMARLVSYRPFAARYAVKANLNLTVMNIAREEGLSAEVTSGGEAAACFAAGWQPRDILFTANNICKDEMAFAIENGVMLSLDSISQVDTYGKLAPGGKFAARVNTGVGAGHHEKVITGGDKTKFGITPENIQELKNTARKHGLKLVGLTQHIGSLFMEGEPYLNGLDALLETAENFEGLEFIDAGGGFGIPYHKLDGENRMDLKSLGGALDARLAAFSGRYAAKYGGGAIGAYIEPGRYIAAECGVLLGTVTSVKYNGAAKYIGSDIGFSVLQRPMLYGSHHDLVFYCGSGECEPATVVGNICESGDVLAKDRLLPKAAVGDVFAALDAGAYGASMSSNYNNRPRPAEILIRADGGVKITRRRDTIEDMLAPYESV